MIFMIPTIARIVNLFMVEFIFISIYLVRKTQIVLKLLSRQAIFDLFWVILRFDNWKVIIQHI